MYVKIKTWKRMEREFGLDKDGEITCKGIFLKKMEKVMPEDRMIDIHKYGKPYDFGWQSASGCWEISRDMIDYEVFKIYTIYGERYNIGKKSWQNNEKK